jgi:hypothetical protein
MSFRFSELQIPSETGAKNIKLKDLKPFRLILLQKPMKSGEKRARQEGEFHFGNCYSNGAS